jgi:membrane-bound serine protease (ClpP class)
MKRFRSLLFTLLLFGAFAGHTNAQGGQPLAIVLDADGAIMPAMQEYIERGIQVAEREGAEVLIIRLDTPGGDLMTTKEIIESMRASRVPVVVFVGPNGAIAGSAGALITMGGHASAMAPETAIGASSPISGSGEELDTTSETKAKEISKAIIRPLVEPRGKQAVELAEAMIDVAKAVTAREALEIGLIDFICSDIPELLEKLDGFTVQMADGPHTLDTANARAEPLAMSFIEELILMLTDPNIVFLLITIGVQAILIEISSPGGWVAGFIGVVCLALGGYGLGILPVNWLGLILLVAAFVLFILDIKAPTHGALTTAGVASFIAGALVLFNSPGTPQFQQVSIPLVIGAGIVTGLVFLVIVGFGIRAMRAPIRTGEESLTGKTGTARTKIDEMGGQVQMLSELWSAELAEGAAKIRKGEAVEVVDVEGLRLIVRKK